MKPHQAAETSPALVGVPASTSPALVGVPVSTSPALVGVPASTSPALVGVPVAAGFSITKTDDGKFMVTEVATVGQRIAVGDVIVSFGSHTFSPRDSLDRVVQIFKDQSANVDENYQLMNAGRQLVVSRQIGSGSKMQFKIRIQPAHLSLQDQLMPEVNHQLSDNDKRSYSPQQIPKFCETSSVQTDKAGSAINAIAKPDDDTTEDISIGADPYDSDDTLDMNLFFASPHRPMLKRERSTSAPAASDPKFQEFPKVLSSSVELRESDDSDPSSNRFDIRDKMEAPSKLKKPFVPDPSSSHSTMAGTLRSYAADFRAKHLNETFSAAFCKKPACKVNDQSSTLSMLSMLFTQSLSSEAENHADATSDLKHVNAAICGETRKKANDHRVAMDFGAAFREKKPELACGSLERNEVSLKKMLFG